MLNTSLLPFVSVDILSAPCGVHGAGVEIPVVSMHYKSISSLRPPPGETVPQDEHPEAQLARQQEGEPQ